MMLTTLLVFEFLGTSELMIIAVVALIIFGPRKLPEIGRSLGRSIGEFKRASEDFKRTWEYEVEIEQKSPVRTQPAGGGVEGMSGAVAPGELEAGGAPVARGSGLDEDTTTTSTPSVIEAQGDAATQTAEPADAHTLLGEDLTAQSAQSAEPSEPRES
jgi:TatA/E family protein of Tat protein translocase